MFGKNKSLFLFGAGLALLLVILASLALRESFVNAQNIFNSSAVKNEAVPTGAENTRPRVVPETNKPEINKPAVVIVPANAAAQQNAQLKNNLEWAFGGRAQRGWYIYVPLIQHTIGTESAPESNEFVLSLSQWQWQQGLPATGVLENETLMQMVKWWQSRRLNSSAYPAPHELLSAPIADFYDPTRAADLLGVERQTYAAYKRMVAAAAQDPALKLVMKDKNRGEFADEEKFLKIVSAFRSREYQEKLRRESPNSGRAGLAKFSPHFTGRALDIYVGGLPVDTKDFNRAFQVQTPVYKWLVKNAERFGFYPYYYEPWHWEYVPNQAQRAPQIPKIVGGGN